MRANPTSALPRAVRGAASQLGLAIHSMDVKMNDNGAVNNWPPIMVQTKASKTSFLRCSTKWALLIEGILIVVLTLFLIWSCTRTAKEEHKVEPLCLTKECIKISSTILERMDPAVSPCEDFYHFSCGNFIRSNTVPEDYYARNLLQEMQEGMFIEMKNYLEAPLNHSEANHILQIKQLYMSCINETDDDVLLGTSIEALFDLIIELTGNEWPILTMNQATLYEDMPFERQLALLFLHQVQPFFQIFVAPHKNSSSYALHIFPGSTVMEQLNFGISKHLDNLSDAQIDLYMNFQRDVIRTFMTFKSEEETKERKELIDSELNNMLRFEMDLVNITKDISLESGNCSYDNNTEPFESDFCEDRLMNPNLFLNISLSQMDRQFSYIKWKQFFHFILQEADVTAKHALIHSKEYFRSLIDILKAHSERTVMNYMGWSVIAKYMPYLGQQFKHLSSEFQQKIVVSDTDMNEISNGFKYYQSRWKQCVYIACEGLKIPSIALYLGEHKQNLTEMSQRIVQLIEEMKRSFLKVIEGQTWIESKKIKQILKRRVSSIRSNIGVPEYIRNQTLVNAMYSDLKVDPAKELISNIFKINKHETVLEMKKLKCKVNTGAEWLFQPLDANAFYDFTSNDIIMPIGIMRSPLVYPKTPKYLELSFLGIVIGHEIAHSIDINSRKHITEKSDILSKGSFGQIYKRKAQCFSEKYSSYMVDETNQYINGNQTLEENICDFASFQTAYSIYKKISQQDNLRLPGLEKFSTDQIFFIQYAQLWCEVATKDGHTKSLQDNHSPGKYRANGVLMNSKLFATSFKCMANSKMNPPDKCDLWTAGY